MNWIELREQFPAIKHSVYLNSASASPISKQAADEGKQFYDDVLLHGDSNWEEWLRKVEEVREKVARLINADKSEIAFIPNTSYGMNLVSEMLKGKGDVVTMNDEFPSSTYPWINRGFKLNFAMPERCVYDLGAIRKQLTKETKILVTSHVQFSTGFKQNLAEVGQFCKENDLIYVVNATQSIGAMPVDIKKSNIDFLVFSSVKWLMTGEGIGAIYINKKWHNRLKWPIVGWLSVKDDGNYDNKNLRLKEDASVLDIGALPLHSIFVMGKAIDIVSEIGADKIENRLYELGDYLIKKITALNLEILSPIEKKRRTGMVIVKVKDPDKVAGELFKKNIIVSARREGLRVSVHIYNNEEDIDKFAAELKRIIQLQPLN